jgi:rhodanese-related sulfurtransferase
MAEHTSALVARELMRLGFTNVAVLKGGWNEWVKAGFPTDTK